MSYKLRFHALALAEWCKLDGSVREALKKQLAQSLISPRIPDAALSGMKDWYKIKLRSQGYRLIYRVDEEVVFVSIIAVGKREKYQAYCAAKTRLG
ncbi:MAG: type II toxin-antitoxin system RelE/ParE family toxin [Polaromonas sp.]